MLNIGPQELIVILIIALLVVGPQRLPELSRQIGRGLREFRKIQDDVKDTLRFDMNAGPDPEPHVRAASDPSTVADVVTPDVAATDETPSPNGSQAADAAGSDAEPRAAE